MILEVSTWEEFVFGDLISEIYKGKPHTKDELNPAPPTTDVSHSLRYITRTAEDNGCEMLVTRDPSLEEAIEAGNAISIGDTTATCFYQSEVFITGDHMVVVRAEWLNPYTGFFITTLLNAEAYRYSYGRAFIISSIRNTRVRLPIQRDANGKPIIDYTQRFHPEGYIPDWQFMEDYIRSLHHKPLTTKNDISEDLSAKLKLSDWVWFTLGGSDGLFDIRKGKRLTAADQTVGMTPYIGAIDSNNGVSNRIGQTAIHDGNTISLSYNGSVGEAFYQPEPYWSTDDVNALYLKPEHGALTPAIGLFISTVLRQERYRFSYGRKWTLDNMNVASIKLPATAEGVPDWQLMEDYMRSLPFGDRIPEVGEC